MLSPNRLWLFLIAEVLSVGCEEATKMEIDANSTTNPPHYNRTISDDAVDNDHEGSQAVSEQVTNTEIDAKGPSQDQSLEGAYNLGEFKGQNVLLVFAGSPDIPEYQQLKSSWKATEQNNDIILVESLLKGRSPEAAKTLADGESQVMRSRYGIQPPQFKAVLVGPDGEAVEEWDDAVSVEQVLEAMKANTKTNSEQTSPE